MTYCSKHYMRLRRHGSASGRPPWTVRFWESVDKTDGCWLWTRPLKRGGYGHIRHDGIDHRAHRASWELTNGPISEGMQVDHLCHNRACVNPEHLRLVTNQQNSENRRGADRDSLTGVRGVTPGPAGSWVVRIRHKGKTFHVGTFYTLEDAEAASRAKRLEVFTHSDMDTRALADG